MDRRWRSCACSGETFFWTFASVGAHGGEVVGQVPANGVAGGYVYAPLPAQASQGAARGPTNSRNFVINNNNNGSYGSNLLQVGVRTLFRCLPSPCLPSDVMGHRETDIASFHSLGRATQS